MSVNATTNLAQTVRPSWARHASAAGSRARKHMRSTVSGLLVGALLLTGCGGGESRVTDDAQFCGTVRPFIAGHEARDRSGLRPGSEVITRDDGVTADGARYLQSYSAQYVDVVREARIFTGGSLRSEIDEALPVLEAVASDWQASLTAGSDNGLYWGDHSQRGAEGRPTYINEMDSFTREVEERCALEWPPPANNISADFP